MIEMKQIIIPIALFLFITIVIIIALNLTFQYLQRRLALETAKRALENHQQVDSSLIEAIVKDKRDASSDLKRGVLLAASSVATMIFSFALGSMGYNQAFKAMMGISAFPGLIGLTYLSFHFLSFKK